MSENFKNEQPLQNQAQMQPPQDKPQQPQQQTQSSAVTLSPNTQPIKQKAEPTPNKARIPDIIITIACLTIQLIMLILLFTGLTTAFYENVNIITAFNYILRLFSISRGNIYRTLSGIVISAVYFFTLVCVILNIVNSCKVAKGIFDKKANINKKSRILLLCKNVLTDTRKYIFIILLCYLLSGSNMSASAYVVIVLGALLYLTANIAVLIEQIKKTGFSTNAIPSLFVLLRLAFFTLTMSLLAKYLLSPSIFNLSFHVRVIFGGHFGSGFVGIVETLYESIIKDIIGIVSAWIYFRMLSNILGDNGALIQYRKGVNRDASRDSIILLVLTGISAVFACVLSTLRAGVTSMNFSTFKGWFTLIRLEFLPVILIIIAIMLISSGVFEFSETEKVAK